MSAAIGVLVLLGVFIYLFPYTWMVMTAFRKPVDTFARPPKFFFDISLAGFDALFHQAAFYKYLVNSTIVTTSTVAVTITLALPAAYALAHIQKRARAFLAVILIARMLPAVSLVVPMYLIGSSVRQLDTYQILIFVNVAFNLTFAVWMLRSFFMDVPDSLREAALVDGASEWQVLTGIMIPLVRPGIAATSVFIFIAVWNEFLFALILTGTRAVTAPAAVLSFRTAYGVQWDSISAAAFLVSLPVLVFAFVMQRYLVQGLTLGAVK